MRRRAVPALVIAALTLAGCQKISGYEGNPFESRNGAAQPAAAEPSRPPQRVKLDRLLTFTDPRHCYLNEAGEQLVRGLHRYGDGQPITLGKVDAPDRYLPAFGSPTLHELRAEEAGPGEESVMEARLPVDAVWHGLKLIGIEPADQFQR